MKNKKRLVEFRDDVQSVANKKEPERPCNATSVPAVRGTLPSALAHSIPYVRVCATALNLSEPGILAKEDVRFRRRKKKKTKKKKKERNKKTKKKKTKKKKKKKKKKEQQLPWVWTEGRICLGASMPVPLGVDPTVHLPGGRRWKQKNNSFWGYKGQQNSQDKHCLGVIKAGRTQD